MKRVLIICLCLGLLLLASSLFLRLPKPTPVAIIRVVDGSGRPVAGAVVQPDGLRSKNSGGHYRWPETREPKPGPVTTDKNGIALVPYPLFVVERFETGEISFSVDHPNFCPDRPFRTVDPAPPRNAKLLEKLQHYGNRLLRRVRARPPPVVLQPGAIVQAAGYIGSKDALVTNLIVDVSSFWIGSANKHWRAVAPTVSECRQIPAGNRALRLAHAAADGSLYFSEVVSFAAVVGATNRFELELKRGRRLLGRLEESVPRPITNGRVVMEVMPAGSPKGEDAHHWHSWTNAAADGSFSFDSQPPGAFQIVVLCDGFVSQHPSFGRRFGVRAPQIFTNPPPDQPVVIAMEPTATLEVTTLGDLGQPLPGARVGLWPSVIWADRGTTVLASDLYNTADFLRPNPPDRKKLWEQKTPDFEAVTGSNGVAIIRNLPVEADAFGVGHDQFELPVRWNSGQSTRARNVKLTPGQTNHQTVTLQKRGIDFLQH